MIYVRRFNRYKMCLRSEKKCRDNCISEFHMKESEEEARGKWFFVEWKKKENQVSFTHRVFFYQKGIRLKKSQILKITTFSVLFLTKKSHSIFTIFSYLFLWEKNPVCNVYLQLAYVQIFACLACRLINGSGTSFAFTCSANQHYTLKK